MNCNQNISAIFPESETIRYQYSNHLGSACLELDSSAAIISYEEYHPFGTTSYRSGTSETEVSLKRYKYVGKERDEETGLYYFEARYYCAWIGRFISTDKKANEMLHFSPYGYAYNNPLVYIDDNGQKPKITISKSEDGKIVDIIVTNDIYVVKHGRKAKNYDLKENEVDEYLKGGSYSVDGIQYNVTIQNNIEYVKSIGHAQKLIDGNQGSGVIVNQLSTHGDGSSFSYTKGEYDYINLKYYEITKHERILAHELGHFMGFADKYINLPGNVIAVMQNFTNALMGAGLKPMSDYELQLLGSDVMEQYGNDVDNGSYGIFIDYAVNIDKDLIPQNQIISVCEYDINLEQTVGYMFNIKITSRNGTPSGKIK
ncbi:MAG: RHS repeat-associated core domain-containing protein [Bacteroidales bacterium]|nr:RHS repeat-associated core domain-containing protein [Bacteroidales bacterium]